MEGVVTTGTDEAQARFTFWFRSVVAALGERTGWYGVFASREPQAARTYESGAEVPPWDVVLAVLHDLAARGGGLVDNAVAERARAMHREAVAAWDAAPGAREALRARLDAATRARDLAVLREREAVRALDHASATPSAPNAGRLTNVLAWARDDRERATARHADLRTRLAALSGAPELPADWFRPAAHPGPTGPAGSATPAAPATQAARTAAGRPAPRWGEQEPRSPHQSPQAARSPAPPPPGAFGETPAPEPPPAAEASRRSARKKPKDRGRPRGARFAGAFEEDTGTEEPPPPELPGTSAAPVATESLRGARFAGAPEGGARPAVTAPGVAESPRGARFAGAGEVREAPAAVVEDPRWAAQARQEAARLGALRQDGHTGAAYVVLCEAAEGPAARLPYLVRELERTGLGADVATLLWEVAALPPGPLAAAAAELAAAGRAEDCKTLLHQAAARPPGDIALTAAALCAAGRDDEAGELLGTVARARPAEDAAAVVRARHDLAAPLVAAAERVSKPRRRDVVAALRRAGLPDR